jgi:hypothetical protein
MFDGRWKVVLAGAMAYSACPMRFSHPMKGCDLVARADVENILADCLHDAANVISLVDSVIILRMLRAERESQHP